MIKIVLISVLAVCAMGMDLPEGLGGLGGLGGILGNAKDLLGNIDMDQISAMMKGMKPGDLSNIMENIPPEMMEMVQSMGISKEEIEDAVEHLPEHMDEIKSVVGKDGLKGMLKKQLSEELGVPEDGDMSEAFSGLKEQAKEQLKEMGINVENVDIKSIMPQIVNMLKKDIKESGMEIDLENPEKMKSQIKKMVFDNFGLDEDSEPEEIKAKLMEQFKESLGDMGMDIDLDKPEEALSKVRELLKEQGLELKDGATREDIKEAVLARAKEAGFDLSDPSSMKKNIMGMVKNFLPAMMGHDMEEVPPMQQMPPQPQHTQMMPKMPFNLNLEINVDGGDHPTNIGFRRPGPPTRFPTYLQGAEKALVYAYGDEDNVVRHVMNANNGINSGIITEEAIEELLHDLMHYRLKARVLMAKNHMLEEELIRQRMTRPAASSPFLHAILSKLRA